MVLSTLRRVFQKYPLLANVATCMSLISSADVVCQVIEHKGVSQFNWVRLKNMSIIGAFYYGPVYYYYYRFLDRKYPGKSPRTIVTKMFIDQVLFTIPSLTFFFCAMGRLEHKPWKETEKELQLKFLPTYVTATLFWPAAQFLNFGFIPAAMRVVYTSGATFVWLVILSYIKNRPKLPYILQKIAELTTPSSEVQAQEVMEIENTAEDTKND